jgi:hypothetical protein
MSGKPFKSSVRASIRSHWNNDKVTQTLPLADGKPIDYLTAPPKECGGEECAAMPRPCNRYQCRHHLWVQDERPGRPHSPGARPPTLVRISDGPSCAIDVAREHPDGMTADEVGALLDATSVGERVLQIENRGSLKMRAVNHVCAILDTARAGMPDGTEIEMAFPHNDHHLAGQHFVTVVIRVKEQTAKARQGVTVRKRA